MENDNYIFELMDAYVKHLQEPFGLREISFITMSYIKHLKRIGLTPAKMEKIASFYKNSRFLKDNKFSLYWLSKISRNGGGYANYVHVLRGYYNDYSIVKKQIETQHRHDRRTLRHNVEAVTLYDILTQIGVEHGAIG